jgi:periplasmic divalent cation tolerance protein
VRPVKGNISQLARVRKSPDRQAMLLVAWTTVGDRSAAENLAKTLVEKGLAACVQIDGPIRSHYVWLGKPETADEFRLNIKFIPANMAAVKKWVLENHPYEIPEWIVIRAEDVSEKYLSWARTNCTPQPFNKSQSLS